MQNRATRSPTEKTATIRSISSRIEYRQVLVRRNTYTTDRPRDAKMRTPPISIVSYCGIGCFFGDGSLHWGRAALRRTNTGRQVGERYVPLMLHVKDRAHSPRLRRSGGPALTSKKIEYIKFEQSKPGVSHLPFKEEAVQNVSRNVISTTLSLTNLQYFKFLDGRALVDSTFWTASP